MWEGGPGPHPHANPGPGPGPTGGKERHDSRYRSRGGYRQDKHDLYKTELCENFRTKGSCTYGRKCHFAHGFEEMQYRVRAPNYNTQPCCMLPLLFVLDV